MQLLPDFGKPGTNAHLDNRLNESFLRRLILSGILSTVILFVLVAFFFIPILTLFGKTIGMVIVLNCYCLIIAIVADALRLIPFPVIEILRNQHDSKRRTECKAQARHGIFALPLSFLSATFWCALLSRTLDSAFPVFLILCLVPPFTIMTVIVVADCRSAEMAFVRSVLAFVIVLLAAIIIIPDW